MVQTKRCLIRREDGLAGKGGPACRQIMEVFNMILGSTDNFLLFHPILSLLFYRKTWCANAILYSVEGGVQQEGHFIINL